MQSDFHIEIASQGWWLPAAPGYDPVTQDLCTHGQIDLVIGGEVIAASGGDASYGVSEGALALLRTLSADHSPRSPVADRLIPHGCGAILMMGCPIGIDWCVSHVGVMVRLDDVVKYDAPSERDAIRFANVSALISHDLYRDEIFSFATAAKEPFAGREKVFGTSSTASSTRASGTSTTAFSLSLRREAGSVASVLSLDPRLLVLGAGRGIHHLGCLGTVGTAQRDRTNDKGDEYSLVFNEASHESRLAAG